MLEYPPNVKAKAKGTKKKSEAKAKDNLSEDRPSQGQGQECSRPRTQAQVLSEKKRSSLKFFWRSPKKNVCQKIFQALHKILTIQKIVLSSSRRQANFRELDSSRPRPRTSKCVLEDSTSGVFRRGALSHGPFFGSPVMFKYLRIVRKIDPCPPPLWHMGRKSGQKNRQNLSEDLFLFFFFGLYLNLDR